MTFSKEELVLEQYQVGELYEHLANLHEKTQILCDEIFKNGITSVKLADLRLSEIFSLYNTARLYLSIKEDLQHYEFSSLLTFWNDAYFQIYLVARDSDENTSWMYGKVQNYLGQYEIVEQMLNTKIQELKDLLK